MTYIADHHYQKPEQALWQGRPDSAPSERFFQIVKYIDISQQNNLSDLEPGIVLIGFESDEGVKRNLGRTGANEGPNVLKSQLAKLPFYGHYPVYDVGNIKCVNGDLEGAQVALGKLIHDCHEHNHKTLVFGGGHETAWGHYLGLKTCHPYLGIINFDAHFDLRQHQQSTSGTPFRQIADDKLKLNQPFDYYCFGIQKFANTRSLFDKATELNVQYLTGMKINQTQQNWQISHIEDFITLKSSLYVSICLDVFSAAIAPGVSAPQPFGLIPWQVLPILHTIFASDKVVSVDIVELAPKFDINHRTSHLASSLAAEVVYNL